MMKDINVVASSESFMYFGENKPFGYDVMEAWISFWIIYTPIMLILALIPNKSFLILKGLFLIIPFFIMIYIKVYIKSNLKYLLANLGVILLTFAVSFTLEERLLFVGATILLFIVSLRQRKRGIVTFYSIFMLVGSEVWMAFLYVISVFNNYEYMMVIISFVAVNLAICCTIYIHLSRNLKLMEWEDSAFKKAEKTRVKLKYIWLTALTVIVLAIFSATWLTGISAFLDEITRKIYRFALKFNSGDGASDVAAPGNTTGDSSSKQRAFQLPKGEAVNTILATIVKVIAILIIILIILILIHFIKKIIVALIDTYKSLNKRGGGKKEKREIIFSFEEIKDEYSIKTKKLIGKIINPFDGSNRKKIRKLYFKLIKNYKTKGVVAEASNTPVEIKNNINAALNEDLKDITDIYEKARYSSQECTKEDVEKLKK